MDTPIDPRDAALLGQCPVLAVPPFGALAPMRDCGQRMLLAADGPYVEVRTPALHAVQRAGAFLPGLRLPYGRVEASLTLPFGRFPLALMEEFIAVARAHCPSEVAGAMVYDHHSGAVRLAIHPSAGVSTASVTYSVERLPSHQSLVLDLHSHGLHPAFFSAQDDRDDNGVKMAAVVGNLDAASVTVAMRLCINGLFVPLPNRWERPAAPPCDYGDAAHTGTTSQPTTEDFHGTPAPCAPADAATAYPPDRRRRRRRTDGVDAR